MPNHIHLLIDIRNREKRLTARVNPTISDIVGSYKSVVANLWLTECKRNGFYMGKIWQSSFFDHIIRNEADYLEIWRYINENPLKFILKSNSF